MTKFNPPKGLTLEDFSIFIPVFDSITNLGENTLAVKPSENKVLQLFYLMTCGFDDPFLWGENLNGPNFRKTSASGTFRPGGVWLVALNFLVQRAIAGQPY